MRVLPFTQVRKLPLCGAVSGPGLSPQHGCSPHRAFPTLRTVQSSGHNPGPVDHSWAMRFVRLATAGSEDNVEVLSPPGKQPQAASTPQPCTSTFLCSCPDVKIHELLHCSPSCVCVCFYINMISPSQSPGPLDTVGIYAPSCWPAQEVKGWVPGQPAPRDGGRRRTGDYEGCGLLACTSSPGKALEKHLHHLDAIAFGVTVN